MFSLAVRSERVVYVHVCLSSLCIVTLKSSVFVLLFTEIALFSCGALRKSCLWKGM